MSREAWCYWMMLSAGGCLGVLGSLISPLMYLVFAAALFLSVWRVMRIDEREFWRRLREGKD